MTGLLSITTVLKENEHAGAANKSPLLEKVRTLFSCDITVSALNRNVAPATQNQPLNTLSFLYKAVLERPLDKSIGFTRAKKKQNHRWH